MNQYGQIIAIGGGGFGRNPNKPIIEEYILKLANSNDLILLEISEYTRLNFFNNK